jgi:integrase
LAERERSEPPVGCPTAVFKYTHFKRACARAGLDDLRFHDLRHTTASLLIKRGYSLKLVGEVLGHRSLQAANRYAYLKVSALLDVFGGAETPACV